MASVLSGAAITTTNSAPCMVPTHFTRPSIEGGGTGMFKKRGRDRGEVQAMFREVGEALRLVPCYQQAFFVGEKAVGSIILFIRNTVSQPAKSSPRRTTDTRSDPAARYDPRLCRGGGRAEPGRPTPLISRGKSWVPAFAGMTRWAGLWSTSRLVRINPTCLRRLSQFLAQDCQRHPPARRLHPACQCNPSQKRWMRVMASVSSALELA